MTECDSPQTNSAACTRWFAMLQRGIQRAGRTSSIAEYMETLALNASLHSFRKIVAPIDLSASTEAHAAICGQAEQLALLVESFLLQTEIATSIELERLRRGIIVDLYGDSFHAIWSLTTIVGKKAADT